MTNKKELQERIVKLLSSYANEMEDERLGSFLALSIGRVLLKTDIDYVESISTGTIKHIADWLKASIINNDQWLNNVDDQNRPKKLMKFASIDQITKEADKAMLLNAQKSYKIDIDANAEEIVSDLGDGYYIVKMLTPEALDRESSYMQHCIGQGAYDNKLKVSAYHFLSLRDSSNKPHATMEIVNQYIVEIRGKQNRPVIKKYVDLLYPFIKEQKYKMTIYPHELGYVIDSSGNWHEFNELPDNMIVENDLFLSNTEIEKLPSNLEVNGDLSLNNNYLLHEIPENLKVKKNLFINYSGIGKIPSNLFVGGNLEASYLMNLLEFPDGITVNGDISLRDSSIENLPEGFKVNTLNLNYSKIKKLPNRMEVKGSLSLIGTEITHIPKDIKLGADLNLSDSSIKELPENLIVPRILKISHTNLKKLPKGLIVGYDFSLQDTNVEEIADGFEVKGNFTVGDTNSSITKLPKNLKVGLTLCLRGSSVERISDNTTIGSYAVFGGSLLKELPANLSVGMVLQIENTKINKLPNDIKVGQEISFCEGQITHIPDSIQDDVTIRIYDYETEEDDYEKVMSAAEFRERYYHKIAP